VTPGLTETIVTSDLSLEQWYEINPELAELLSSFVPFRLQDATRRCLESQQALTNRLPSRPKMPLKLLAADNI